MNITILGSAAMFATLERAASGYLVEVGETRIWVDAGAGTWRHLLRYVDYRELDGIVLSHRHPDHTTDVFQAFHARHYGGPHPLDEIPLWAPAETIDALLGYSKDVANTFDLRTVADGDEIEIGGARCAFVKMAHPPYTVGLRVEHEGSVFAYSSDTGPGADFDALARSADMFMCEATFQDVDEPWEGHLSASQAGEIAARVDASRLVLTHLPPDRDVEVSLREARATCGGVAVELAADGRRYEGLR